MLVDFLLDVRVCDWCYINFCNLIYIVLDNEWRYWNVVIVLYYLKLILLVDIKKVFKRFEDMEGNDLFIWFNWRWLGGNM